MQLSENDKTLLLSKKEDIRKISSDIFLLLDEPKKNRTQILNLINQIVGNLSDLSAISNYLCSEPDIRTFRRDFGDIQVKFEQDGTKFILRNDIERFCNRANSITFFENVSILSKIEIKLESLVSIFPFKFGK